jgi:FkbM family methyltransferase
MLGPVKRWLLRRIPSAWAGRLRTWRIRRLIRNFPARVVEHSFGGDRLKVYLADPLSQGWYDHDWPPLPEIAELQKSRLRPGARVFDIGAHQGVVAAMLALRVGPSGQVVAVEASDHNCRAAAKTRELNGLSQVEVVRAAVAERPGRLDFNEGLNGQIDDGSGSTGRVSVDAITLDGLAERFGPPDVVFLDVEGAECLALSGGHRVLASGADFFVEVHVGCGLEKLGGSTARVLSFFPADQFELLARAEGDAAFRPLGRDDPLTRDRFFLIARRRKAEAVGPAELAEPGRAPS